MGNHIEFIARGICVENDRVLVCVNTKHGYGYLPGGHVEFGESAAGALVREFEEECGERVAVGGPVLGIELTFEQYGRRRHEVSILFPVKRITKDRPLISLEPGLGFEWWTTPSIHSRDLRPHRMRGWLARTLECGSMPTAMEWLQAAEGQHIP